MSIEKWYIGANAVFSDGIEEQAMLKDRFLHYSKTVHFDSKLMTDDTNKIEIDSYKQKCSEIGTTIMLDDTTIGSILNMNVYFVNRDIDQVFNEFKRASFLKQKTKGYIPSNAPIVACKIFEEYAICAYQGFSSPFSVWRQRFFEAEVERLFISGDDIIDNKFAMFIYKIPHDFVGIIQFQGDDIESLVESDVVFVEKPWNSPFHELQNAAKLRKIKNYTAFTSPILAVSVDGTSSICMYKNAGKTLAEAFKALTDGNLTADVHNRMAFNSNEMEEAIYTLNDFVTYHKIRQNDFRLENYCVSIEDGVLRIRMIDFEFVDIPYNAPSAIDGAIIEHYKHALDAFKKHKKMRIESYF